MKRITQIYSSVDLLASLLINKQLVQIIETIADTNNV